MRLLGFHVQKWLSSIDSNYVKVGMSYQSQMCSPPISKLVLATHCTTQLFGFTDDPSFIRRPQQLQPSYHLIHAPSIYFYSNYCIYSLIDYISIYQYINRLKGVDSPRMWLWYYAEFIFIQCRVDKFVCC